LYLPIVRSLLWTQTYIQIWYLLSWCRSISTKIALFDRYKFYQMRSSIKLERNPFHDYYFVTGTKFVNFNVWRLSSGIIFNYFILDSLRRMLNLNQPLTKSTAVEPVWKVRIQLIMHLSLAFSGLIPGTPPEICCQNQTKIC